MIVWDGMELIGLAIIVIAAVVWGIGYIFLKVGGGISERRKKRWERLAEKKEKQDDGKG